MEAKEGLRLFVYALCEPDGRTIRYIGLSANLWKRLHGHYGHSTLPKIRQWMFSLRERGLVPSMVVLQEVVGLKNGLAAEREQIRIHKDRIGEQLLNELETGLPQRRRPFGERLTLDGKSLTRAQWAKELGISRQALNLRLQSHPVSVALSRGKDAGRPLEDRRLAPVWPTSTEDVESDCGQFDPRPFCVLECERVKTGLNHAQRRVRRKKMAAMAEAGASTGWIANFFRCTTATVEQAIHEFSPVVA
jgi:hypothetical protein